MGTGIICPERASVFSGNRRFGTVDISVTV
jgi:hypothetical protein